VKFGTLRHSLRVQELGAEEFFQPLEHQHPRRHHRWRTALAEGQRLGSRTPGARQREDGRRNSTSCARGSGPSITCADRRSAGRDCQRRFTPQHDREVSSSAARLLRERRGRMALVLMRAQLSGVMPRLPPAS